MQCSARPIHEKRHTAVFGVILEFRFECGVLRLFLDGQRQIEEPVSVVFRNSNALLLERALVDLETDQREYGQHEHGQDTHVAQSPNRFQKRADDRLQSYKLSVAIIY